MHRSHGHHVSSFRSVFPHWSSHFGAGLRLARDTRAAAGVDMQPPAAGQKMAPEALTVLSGVRPLEGGGGGGEGREASPHSCRVTGSGRVAAPCFWRCTRPISGRSASQCADQRRATNADVRTRLQTGYTALLRGLSQRWYTVQYPD